MRMNRILGGIWSLIRRVGKPLRYLAFYPVEAIRPRRDVVTATRYGFRLLCSHENLIERKVMETGVFEPLSSRLVCEVVKAGDVTVDIGANIGYYSLLLAQLVGREGRVYCFEPTEYAVRRLRVNLELNQEIADGVIQVYQLGLLERPSVREEAIESQFSARVLAYSRKERISFTTLDEFFRDHLIDRLDFIKIDVDGYDEMAMRGGSELLGRFRPKVLAEINDAALKSKGASQETYMQYYLDLGYRKLVTENRSEHALAELIESPQFRRGGWSTNVLILSD